MSDTVVSLLTPPGTGAIATVEVSGPRAWELARQLFEPAGKPLPELPELHPFWFGTLGNDEVILAVTGPLPCGRGSLGASSNEPRPQGSGPTTTVEVHCHGGRRVVRWVIEQFVAHGCIERNPGPSGQGFDSCDTIELLQQAPTLRTAAILLDQHHGAFATAVQAILYFLEHTPQAAPAFLKQLAKFAPIGRHLIEPWKVVVAGPPNVGKSSLVNALAGYQRTVVSEVAGTTRDAVSVRIAFDGWPVELIDTAGLREAEGLESEGIDLAKRELEEADLVLWVMDGTASEMVWASDDIPKAKLLAIINKSDVMHDLKESPDAWGMLLVSAITGSGIPELVAEITQRLVPHPPAPGSAVPFTPRLADLVEDAHAALAAGRIDEATRLLRDCLQAN
ncbi:MAG: 50S ribosome-binding GTPase [Planctomycetia bacterium]|nr:50S ribosome-binding GTPase [Planctomycetia bacterium]